MRIRHFRTALSLTALVACGEPVAPTPDSLVTTATGAATDRYIVVFKASVADPESLTDELIRTQGGQVHFRYRSVLQGFAASLSAQALDGIRRNPHVELIAVDAEVWHQGSTTAQTGAPWGLDRIDQRSPPLDGVFSYDRTGTGVTVYLVDSGIRYSHAEFEGRASFGFDVYGGDGSDCSGHGTHVAGTIGGKTFGVAKNVKLVSVRTLNCSASGSVSGIIAGLDWIAMVASGPSTANLSIGAPAYDPLDRAVRRLTQLGMTVVVAASNYNADACNYSPAREPSAITVGASSDLDRKVTFSNWGPCVDLFAPGYGIFSADYASDSGATWKSGTSMSAPHVAGAAALYLEGTPSASPATVESVIVATATQGVVQWSYTENNHLLYTGWSDVLPPPPSEPAVELSVAGTKQKGKSTLLLSWRGAIGTMVRLLLNNADLASVPNTGSYPYQPADKGRRSYVFQVCEIGGLLRCSNTVTITF